jgi:dolichyl-phosphate mannosyltransferase polypeptide 2 regulatory subunit
MLAAAAFVFTYYTTWALFLVRPFIINPLFLLLHPTFVPTSKGSSKEIIRQRK